MKVCIDVHHEGKTAATGLVFFDDWTDAELVEEIRSVSTSEEGYQPGEFCRRVMHGEHRIPTLLKRADQHARMKTESEGNGI